MYNRELEFAKSLAVEAGDIMLQWFQTTSRDWKSDRTAVTEADFAINEHVIEAVSATFPGDSVLGEEESIDKGSNRIWICDPVDGTMPFSHGVQISTFSLALTIDGKPVVGVVYDPFMKRLFYAQTKGGAFLNDTRIHVSTTGMDHALIDIEGFPSTKPAVDKSGSFIDALVQAGANVQCLWSAILPGALIASGEYTALIFNVPKPEDGAALKVIIEEAGGRVTDLFGNERRFDQPGQGFLATNGVVHNQILELLKK